MIRTMIRTLVPVLVFFTGTLLPGILKAQQDEGTLQPLFRSDAILELSLKADFSAVFASQEDTAYFPASMTLSDDQGQLRTVDLKVRKRGLTRSRSDICSFPPLRLNFPKSEMKGTPFSGQNAIKLVTHCDKPEFYEEYIRMEYLIYRIYNILTDSSFKVRPAIVDYVYSGNDQDTVRKFAFFIEREKHLAARLKGNELEESTMHPAQVDPFQACLVDIFQYMIGNTDYSIYEMHNVIMVADPERRRLACPVPYDFDWSGLVSANYAVPHPLMNTSHVSERVYRGIKRDEATVLRVLSLFKDKKGDIYHLLENSGLLSAGTLKKALKYLDGFYETIDDEKKMKRVFFENARVPEEQNK